MALWSGRFAQAPQDTAFALSRSVHFDWRLAPYDLRSSMAHLAVLSQSGLIDSQAASAISKGLQELFEEVNAGSFTPIEADEDVHSALERGLTEKLGALDFVGRMSEALSVVGGFERFHSADNAALICPTSSRKDKTMWRMPFRY